MIRIFQLIGFLTIFLSIYGFVNTYVIWRLNSLLGNHFSKTTLFLIVFSTSAYFFGAIIDRLAHNIFTRVFYGILASWMGILLLLFSMLLIFEIINFFFKIPPKPSFYTILSITTIISIYAIMNAFGIKIKEINIPLKNLKQETTLVQISDLHVGTIHNSRFLEKIVKRVNEINPDFVVITGDLVDGSGPLRPKSYLPLNELKMPTYFVIGNHEIYENLNKVLNVFRELKLKVLQNEKIEINGIQLIGINFSENEKENNLDKITIDHNLPSILLAHNPNEIKNSVQKGIDLQLSGHTHNGQIVPFNLIVKIFYPNIQGLYNYEGTKLYVSPGTGTWGPPMRFGSKNEITLIHLQPE